MQKMLKQIMEEGFEGGNGSLELSCPRIELTIAPGSVYEGSFTVFGRGGLGTLGFVTCQGSFMQCLTEEFAGREEMIRYRFDASNLPAGSVAEGEFCLISNHGEVSLPYAVKVELLTPDSSVGPVCGLEAYASLAKENWLEAVKLFYSSDFPAVLRNEEEKIRQYHKGLANKPGNQRNVEEFLISCGCKKKIAYRVDQEVLRGTGGFSGVSELSVTLRKDGWGYTGLKVTVEGDFLFTEKKYITEDDFLGNQCVLPVYVDGSLLRKGRNFGRLLLSDTHNRLEIPVEISETVYRNGAQSSVNVEKDRWYASLTDYYIKYRLGKIGGAVWLKETGLIIEHLLALNEQDVTARLFQAQLFIAQNRKQEAGWILTHSYEKMENDPQTTPELMAYYLYLITRIEQDKESFRRAAARIEELFHRNKTSWRLAWLVLATSSKLRSQTAEKWEFIKKQFHYGCVSPVWYTEALLCLNSNPALLRRLEETEIQVLYFGLRKDALSEELSEQLLYLAGRKKEYSGVLIRLFAGLYAKRQDVRLLQEICTQLIRGGRTDREAFGWYEKGVEQELRITRLYEYYMLSMDLAAEPPISRKALMYFVWQTNLDYEHAAYLYYYLWKRQNDLPEIVNQYRERMEHFVIDQLLKGHINSHLSYLYEQLLTPPMINGQTASVLSRFLFLYQVMVPMSGMMAAVVCGPSLEEQRRYAILNGCAYVAMYGDDEVLFWEDAEGNRYLSGSSCEKKRLMCSEKLLELVEAQIKPGQADLGFDLYLWDRGSGQIDITGTTVERGLYLLEQPGVGKDSKGEIQMRLLSCCRKKKNDRQLEGFSQNLRWEILSREACAESIRNLVLWGNAEKAYEGLSYAGDELVEPGILVKLCDEMAGQGTASEDKVLISAALKALQHKRYSGGTLALLSEGLKERTSVLLRVAKALKGYSTDETDFLGRVLVQMLFTGEGKESLTEVFRDYVKGAARPEVELAVLSRCATDYLIGAEEQDSLIFEELMRFYENGEFLTDRDKLACLKYAAICEKGAQEQTILQQGKIKLLSDLLEKGIYLGFFRKLSGCDAQLRLHRDKTVVECVDTECQKITIHYRIHSGQEKEPQDLKKDERELFEQEEMKVIPGGLFYKEFILFAGEVLEYYLTKEGERQVVVTERNYRQADLYEMSDSGAESDVWAYDGSGIAGRYRTINRMGESLSTGEFDLLDEELSEFYHREYIGNRLFTIR